MSISSLCLFIASMMVLNILILSFSGYLSFFNRLIPNKFDSRIDFMLEILKYFSMGIAKQKNKSFSYFLERHICKASNSR
ncbi:MAG: hypothetical protein A3G93_11920 [Nitrospinae bacterium RIFCSPLOWO2_12_FULL_45_22]|nr:MAG: hypothetical protein A3G93_11920 [Nitrospinae bacterium RIFCSPLOWO2_12_FULL_45_22]